jgi:hypothetical protein
MAFSPRTSLRRLGPSRDHRSSHLVTDDMLMNGRRRDSKFEHDLGDDLFTDEATAHE